MFSCPSFLLTFLVVLSFSLSTFGRQSAWPTSLLPIALSLYFSFRHPNKVVDSNGEINDVFLLLALCNYNPLLSTLYSLNKHSQLFFSYIPFHFSHSLAYSSSPFSFTLHFISSTSCLSSFHPFIFSLFNYPWSIRAPIALLHLLFDYFLPLSLVWYYARSRSHRWSERAIFLQNGKTGGVDIWLLAPIRTCIKSSMPLCLSPSPSFPLSLYLFAIILINNYFFWSQARLNGKKGGQRKNEKTCKHIHCTEWEKKKAGKGDGRTFLQSKSSLIFHYPRRIRI